MAILYKGNETDFTHFGLGPLDEAVSIFVTEERNGVFELEMKYPISGARFKDLKNDWIIVADAGTVLKNQRFKIIRVTKPMDGIVTVNAEHVSYLSRDLALKPTVSFSGNAEAALRTWKNNLIDENPFIVSSDISTTGKGEWTIDKVENPRRALGGVSGSILDVYGGEYLFDNYHIRLLKQRGVNSAALIAYGRNLVDATQEESIADTYTTIYPYAVYQTDSGKDVLLTLPELIIDSDYVENYQNRKILVVDFSEKEPKTEQALRSLSASYLTSKDIGIPKVNLKVKYVDLSQTDQPVNIIEKISLCDNVPVWFEKMGINTTAKVIKTVWDDLAKRYDHVEIGEARSSFSKEVSAPIEGKIEAVEKQIQIVQVQADGIRLIYRQVERPPNGQHVGDLWYQPNGMYEIMYQWDGSDWKEIFNTADMDQVKREVDAAVAEIDEVRQSANSVTEKVDQAVAAAGFTNLSDTFLGIKGLATTAEANAHKGIANAATALGQANNALGQVGLVSGEVTTVKQNMDAINGILSTKVSSTDFDLLKGTVTNQETELVAAKNALTAKADKTVVDTIANRVTATEGQLSVEADKIVSLLTRVTGTETSINQVKATADSNMATITNHTGRISVVEQNVNGLQVTVADKADKSQITQLANSIQSTVMEELNKLDIAGDNLIPDSNNGKVGWQETRLDGQIKLIDFVSKGVLGMQYSIITPSTGWHVLGKVLNPHLIEKSTQYTFSMDIWTTFDTTISVQILQRDAQNGMAHFGDVKIYANKWNRVELTTSTWGNLNPTNQIIYMTGFNVKGDVWVVNEKLEKGGTATGWKPALSQITQLSNAINLKVSKGDLMSQINLEAGRTLISTNKLYLDSDTVVFSGKAFIPSAAITSLSADKMTTGTLNAANVNLINVNVSSLVGNVSTFVSSAWNSLDATTSITGSGLISQSGALTTRLTGGEVTTTSGTKAGKVNALGMEISDSSNGQTTRLYSDGFEFNWYGIKRVFEQNTEGLSIRPISGSGNRLNSSLHIVTGPGADKVAYIDFKNPTSGDDGRIIVQQKTMGLRHPTGGLIQVADWGNDGRKGEIRAGTFHTTTYDGRGIRMVESQIQALSTNQTIYLLPSGTGELRVGSGGSNPDLWPVRASRFVEGSSRASKTNILPYTGSALAEINRLQAVTFNRKEDLRNGMNYTSLGFIAEDSPFIAIQQPGAPAGVDHYKMATLAIKGIQELDSRTTKTETYVSQHELEIIKLKKRIAKLEEKIT